MTDGSVGAWVSAAAVSHACGPTMFWISASVGCPDSVGAGLADPDGAGVVAPLPDGAGVGVALGAAFPGTGASAASPFDDGDGEEPTDEPADPDGAGVAAPLP